MNALELPEYYRESQISSLLVCKGFAVRADFIANHDRVCLSAPPEFITQAPGRANLWLDKCPLNNVFGKKIEWIYNWYFQLDFLQGDTNFRTASDHADGVSPGKAVDCV